MAEISSRFITIRADIDGAPKEEDFEIVTTKLSSNFDPSSTHVLVKCLNVSIDPYQLNRMKSFHSSQGAITSSAKLFPGKPIDGQGVGRVVASGHPEFREGDLVAGRLEWADYVVVEDGQSLRKLDPMGFPLSYHVGILGVSGLTAYGGFFELCKPKKGERVFVSTAAGSVGNLVGQYAKLSGCYVVGCAGTPEKVALLKEKLGFDHAFNYKEAHDLKSTLRRYFPDGIDVYFDNVGGEMLQAAVANMNHFGRVAACGVIPQYTDLTRSDTALDMMDIIYKRIKIHGFLSVDFFADHLSEMTAMTADHLRTGKIKALEDISYGLENIPTAFVGLFCGRNVGKTVVELADD